MENLLPSSFKMHNFTDKIGEIQISCQIMKMKNSFYIWIGNHNEQNMSDLSLAFVTPDKKKSVTATKIIGPIADETSCNIASRLAKKIGQPVYISFNVNSDYRLLPSIEKRISEEFKQFPELLKS